MLLKEFLNVFDTSNVGCFEVDGKPMPYNTMVTFFEECEIESATVIAHSVTMNVDNIQKITDFEDPKYYTKFLETVYLLPNDARFTTITLQIKLRG